jgi:hypothetical protein
MDIINIPMHFRKKKLKIQNFKKYRSVGEELFHENGRKERQIGMTKIIVAFHNTAHAPKTPGQQELHKAFKPLH